MVNLCRHPKPGAFGSTGAVCALVLSALVSTPLHAQDPGMAQEPAPADTRFDASARVDAYHAPRDDRAAADSSVLTGQFKASTDWSDTVRTVFDARLSTTRRDGQSSGARNDSQLLEAYGSKQSGETEWRLGRQVLAWGRADGINPTDNLTPRDLVTWLPFEDDQRFGVWALRGNTRLSDTYDLTVVVSPWFQGSVIPLPVLPHAVTTASPDYKLANTTFAIKLNRSADAFDWSVSYLRGLSLLPEGRVLYADAMGPGIEFHYDRVQVLGADMARNVGRFGLRAEAAMTWTHGSDDGRPAQRTPDLFVVAGVDHTVSGNLNVNLQAIGRHVMRFNDPYAIAEPGQRQMAIQNAITVGQQDSTTWGYSLRVSDKWLEETLQGEVLLVDFRTRDTRALKPMLSYAVTDRIKTTLGAVIYCGADDTLFGRKKHSNRIYLELRYAP